MSQPGSCRTAFLIALALSFGSAVTQAAPINNFSFQGDFSSDDDYQVFGFYLSEWSEVTMYTLSYAGSLAAPGGTNRAGEVIARGGFAPVLSLFYLSGELVDWSSPYHRTAVCDVCDNDEVTESQFDAYLKFGLDPGAYLLVLTEDENLPWGPYLSDGFMHAGEWNFTGAAFDPFHTTYPDARGSDYYPLSFIDANKDPRTKHWAVDILGVDDARATPEPGAFWLLIIGILAISIRCLHRNPRGTPVGAALDGGSCTTSGRQRTPAGL